MFGAAMSKRHPLAIGAMQLKGVSAVCIVALTLFIGIIAPSQALARDEKAFVWLMFAPPVDGVWEESKIFTVDGMNGNGDITGRVTFGADPTTRGFVYTLDGYFETWHLLPPTYETTIKDINDSRTVVGWTSGDTGRRWVYSSGYTTPGSGDTFEDDQVWGIDNYGNMVGKTDTGTPEAWYAEWSGWGAFNPLSGGTATAALGLNNNVASPDACGVSTDSGNNEQAVVWPSGSLDASLLPPSQYPDLAYRINDNRYVIGSRYDGSTNQFVLWKPATATTWNNSIDLGVQSSLTNTAGAINNSNEFVVFRTFFYYDDGGTLQSVDLEDLVDIPDGVIESGLRFEAINDRGWMAGYAPYGEATDRRAIIIIPRDDNNNGVPDYRDIYSDPDTYPDADGDWILDETEMLHVGVFPVLDGTEILGVANVQAIRVIRDQADIENAVRDINPTYPTSCDNQVIFMDRWGGGDGSVDQLQKEIVVTIRTQRPADHDQDYIPPATTSGGELGQDDILRDQECFAKRFPTCVDYVQIGNEIFGGAGGAGGYYVANIAYSGGTYTGTLKDTPNRAALDASLDAVFGWMDAQIAALRRGSAIAGRPLRLIGPALTLADISIGLNGDADSTATYDDDPTPDPDRNAYYIQRLIEFCNDYAIALDIHYHFWDDDAQFQAGADAVDSTPGNTDWDAPDLLVSLEFGPTPSRSGTGFWWTSGNKDLTERFFDGNSGTHPPNQDTWAEWVDHWQHPTNGDQLLDLPTGFIGDGFSYLDGKLYRLALYSNVRQSGTPTTTALPFDLAALYLDKVDTGEEWSDEWVDAYEGSAAAFMIPSFTPHPNPCPEDPCPPCADP